MLQLYLTPGESLPSSAVFIVGPGVRTEGEGMSAGSPGLQDRLYPVSAPLVTVGACHEKLRLVVVINVTWNILGGPGATGGKFLHYNNQVLSRNDTKTTSNVCRINTTYYLLYNKHSRTPKCSSYAAGLKQCYVGKSFVIRP